VRQIAYLCGHDTISWSTHRRRDAYEHDLALRHFKDAFYKQDRLLVEVLWNDQNIDWHVFESAIIGSTWDYTQAKSEFVGTLTRIASSIPLYNEIDLIKWNIDKRYLRQLSEGGVGIIPTIWESSLGDSISEDKFERLKTHTIIVKPTLGACSEGQILVKRGERQDLSLQRNQSVMLQRFYSSISKTGEKSFIFYGTQFSHSVLKIPAPKDYRVQSIFDGTERAYSPSENELKTCKSILAKIPSVPLYCRIDLVDLPSGDLALMECEVIEPYLYPTYSHEGSKLFVDQYLLRQEAAATEGVRARLIPPP
jgi:hypothetical protein